MIHIQVFQHLLMLTQCMFWLYIYTLLLGIYLFLDLMFYYHQVQSTCSLSIIISLAY